MSEEHFKLGSPAWWITPDDPERVRPVVVVGGNSLEHHVYVRDILNGEEHKVYPGALYRPRLEFSGNHPRVLAAMEVFDRVSNAKCRNPLQFGDPLHWYRGGAEAAQQWNAKFVSAGKDMVRVFVKVDGHATPKHCSFDLLAVVQPHPEETITTPPCDPSRQRPFRGRIVRIGSCHWFTYGRYKIGGQEASPIEEIARHNPSYLYWMVKQENLPADLIEMLRGLIEVLVRPLRFTRQEPRVSCMPQRRAYAQRRMRHYPYVRRRRYQPRQPGHFM